MLLPPYREMARRRRRRWCLREGKSIKRRKKQRSRHMKPRENREDVAGLRPRECYFFQSSEIRKLRCFHSSSLSLVFMIYCHDKQPKHSTERSSARPPHIYRYYMDKLASVWIRTRLVVLLSTRNEKDESEGRRATTTRSTVLSVPHHENLFILLGCVFLLIRRRPKAKEKGRRWEIINKNFIHSPLSLVKLTVYKKRKGIKGADIRYFRYISSLPRDSKRVKARDINRKFQFLSASPSSYHDAFIH